MSSTITVSREDEFAERWRHWQLGNAKSSRRGEIQARIAFAVVVILTLTYLSLRLL
jgi:hypothetical protein